MERMAVLGATGAIGRVLTRDLARRGFPVRAVAADAAALEQAFGDLEEVQRLAADLTDPDGALEAVDDCSLVILTLGLAVSRYDRHPIIGKNVAEATELAGIRSMLISRSWSYSPGAEGPIDEEHPRENPAELAVHLRTVEDRMLDIGATVAMLPELFGSDIPDEAGVLIRVLPDAFAGKKVVWFGDPDVEREFLYLGDAGRMLGELVECEEAEGKIVNVPGSGVVRPRHLVELAAHIGERKTPKIASLGAGRLKLGAFVDPVYKEMASLLPIYQEARVLDGSRYRELVGTAPTTPYEPALRMMRG